MLVVECGVWFWFVVGDVCLGCDFGYVGVGYFVGGWCLLGWVVCLV